MKGKPMQEMIPFTYEGTPMRTVVVESEPWFVSMDALDILGLHRSSLTALDDDEKGVHTVDTLGGVQRVGIISEPGLYSLILRSRKPEAKAFKVKEGTHIHSDNQK
jgi:anti-repressor protein